MRASSFRRPLCRQPARGKRLLFEVLDERALLAVVANDDGPYTTNEDMRLDVAGGAADVLIPRGSTWSYFDQMTNGRGTPATPTETYPTDDAADADNTPGVADAWNSLEFNTASSDPSIGVWKSGPAVFGKGTIDGGTVIPIVTMLEGNEASGGGGAVNTVTTYLFRSTFTISAATLASNPAFVWNLLADDGGILYIDGQEVGRARMPATVDATTHANATSERVQSRQ